MDQDPQSWLRRYRLPLAVSVVVLGLGAGTAVYVRQSASSVRPPQLPAVAPVTPVPEPSAPALPPTALIAGTQDVAILMYHDITNRPTVYFDVTVASFRKQLKQLEAAGATVIPLADLYEHLRNGKSLPPKSVVLTFDDGYAGQYENAYPILKELGYPATFFVHTGAVGVTTSRQHITWEQLQAIDKEGLISVECHTVSHPDDLRKCSDAQLETELKKSKETLEQKLGRKIRFLAYPVGNADARVARVAHEAGYEQAFTMGPGWAGSPEDALFTPRFSPTRLPEVMARLQNEDLVAPIEPKIVELKPQDLESGFLDDHAVRMRWVRGGVLTSARLNNRQDVPSIIRAAAAPAGLNGTFFSDARVNSQGAGIVGPILSRLGPGFAPGLPGDRPRIAGRPLVLISPKQMAFLPFRPHLALDEEGVRRLLPDVTDCFLGGAWLIHNGKPLEHEELERFGLSNIFDFRPRAMLGIDNQGRPFLGAAMTGNASDRLAQSLAKLGLEECVLLDSGFSTSLVLGQEVLVSGIVRADMPARPVPHALLLYPVDPETGKENLAYPRLQPKEVGPPLVPTFDSVIQRFTPPPPEIVEPGDKPAATTHRPRRPRKRRRQR
jgi:peptidoglycan/xylan/chitin deacetylase (PgdA/CDA1 family)